MIFRRVALLFLLMGISINSFSSPIKNVKTIRSVEIFQVDEKGVAIQTSERIYKIINEAGRVDMAFIRAQYSKSLQTFDLVEAYSILDGKVSLASKDQIKTTAAAQKGPSLNDIQEVSIPMNQLQVGSEIHVKYKITSKPIIGNVFFQALGVSNSELADTEFYQIESKIPLLTYSDNIGEFYTLEQTNDPGHYKFEIRPTKKAYLFEGTKIETAVLMVSSATNWKQLNELLEARYNAAIEAPLPEGFQKIVQEAGKITDVKSQIEFVAGQISSLVSYSGNWTTTDGMFFPQGHLAVLKNGKGDCKDYSTSMVAILRKLNFTAFPALTFRSTKYIGPEQIHKMAELPSLESFNHAIVWAKDQKGKVWWIDPTNPIVMADVLSADILGNYALILDKTSNQVTFLPTQNSTPSDLTIEQKISFLADNTIAGTGQINMTPSMYNMIAMSERTQGFEATKKIFSAFLNAISKMQMDLKKDSKDKTSYSYSFRASDWVHEQRGKFRSLVVLNPVGLFLQGLQPKAVGDLGEPGTVKIVTHVLNEKVIDTTDAECLVRSPWMDLDRTVENKSGEILVTDTIGVKQRFVSKEEASSDIFETNYNTVLACLRKSALVLSMDASVKTAEMLEKDKIRGPPVETMSDADALALEKLSGPKFGNYSAAKRYHYYSNKLLKNKNDSDAYFQKAMAIRYLGYMSNEDYQPAYLQEADQELDLAIKTAGERPNPKYYQKEIFNMLALKQAKEAGDLFKILFTKAPGDFSTYISAFKIAAHAKSDKVAEKWIRASEALAMNEDQKDIFHAQMSLFLKSQKKDREALAHEEYFLNKDPKNPWTLHNMAVVYASLHEYDKSIDFEKRALEITDFGAGRENLANSYYNKAVAELGQQKARGPASAAPGPTNELFLQALKVQPDHMPTLKYLSGHFLDLYKQQKDELILIQGRAYLDKALEKEPSSPDLLKLLESYKSLAKN